MATRRSTWSSAGINIGAEYTDEEREFLVAVDLYKRSKHRPYPTWEEIFKIMIGLGYSLPAEEDLGTATQNFLQAMNRLKEEIRHPTWKQVLRVAQELGWKKPR